ncbi:MAG: serine hydrolase [bacterium]|nr:serine hydrolase [bacterium]
MIRANVFVTFVIICVASTTLQAQRIDPVEARLKDICKLISGVPLRMDSVFAESFLQKVTPSQLLGVVSQITEITGTCTGTNIISKEGGFGAKAEASTTKGYVVPILINVSATYPFKIEGLYLQNPIRATGTLETIAEGFKELPGFASLHIVNIATNSTIVSYNADMSLPIGSAFKLYVLGELARAIDEGEHKWDEVVTLDTAIFSLPSGTLQTWPHGSPVTLHTLATMMISISDNTATDALIHVLTAKKVEAVQAEMGHKNPDKNSPFLTTRELFLLKFTQRGDAASRYARSTRDVRAGILKDEIHKTSLDSISLVSRPILPDSVEWFATTKGMVAAMVWLRNQGEKSCCNQLRGILAVNAGLDINVEMFPYVGYKGGSEPGVMNMTYLLRRKDNTWFALSASWLRKDADVDATRFSADIAQAIRLLGL